MTDQTLSEMLAAGDIDAMIAYKPPPVFLEGHAQVGRLFEDYPAIERDYARRSGIFPIMHLIGIRRELARQRPELAVNICRGFDAARRYAFDRLAESQALFTMLPWGAQQAADAVSALGDDFWAYGLPPNRPAIEALCRYSFAQGISPREVVPEELFAHETLDWRS